MRLHLYLLDRNLVGARSVCGRVIPMAYRTTARDVATCRMCLARS